MPLLAIETTCDETAAAIISPERQILSSVVASQDELHARWRGVVPEIASRAHVERIIPVIHQATDKAGIQQSQIKAVAVAIRPGLIGSLLIGLSAAKAIASSLQVPLIGYDHLAAHLYACRLAFGEELKYPAIGLVASGGHTSLFQLHSPITLQALGGTIDDAIGEAFDKVASLLGLGYPGGPQIEKLAEHGNPHSHRFPRPLANDSSRLDFSFSGLKTAVRYQIWPPGDLHARTLTDKERADLAASFQQAAVDSVVAKVGLAIQKTGYHVVAVGGGVTANKALRSALEELEQRHHVTILIPPTDLCTDNAAMGAIAWEHIDRNDIADLELDVRPNVYRKKKR
ncbi:MAG TPA: tRNA (adenosine(37)-N6)-threonylcarbamoyltransferase complex transferase subunit TsaD [Planctomycetaceae bacterium]|nr:tRNA (adenosine(37)-N6)-threonylcarbamoyltransferase complex transferase subunit TsaD [Planctomycetaceae bacterium]